MVLSDEEKRKGVDMEGRVRVPIIDRVLGR
jgi:hypothetical protein